MDFPFFKLSLVPKLNINLKLIAMKRLLLLLFLTVATLAFSQKIKKIDSITFNEVEKLTGNKSYKKIVDVNHYRTKSGNWIKVGDTLVVGSPSNKNNLESNAYTNGATNNHTHIFLGSTGAAMFGVAFFANENMTGDKMFVTEIKMGRISKKQPFEIVAQFNKVGGGRFLSSKKLARASLEKALSSGEIINPKAKMTRKEAIKKLKEAKELLEIDMMTKDEFDALKKKLAPIIKGN